jgi:AraC-like DNA-binding protein
MCIRDSDGTRHCIEIALRPWAANRLFQGASTEFAKETIALENIWGKDANMLIEQLSEISSWSKQFSLIDRVLVEKFITSHSMVRPEIRWAWNQLESQGGCLSIRQLAKTIGWSDRHFAKCFREQIGMTPKAAARQIRFTQAHRLLTASDDYALSEIALICGYSDQSHFTREFHSFSGCSPTTYQKAHFANLPGIPGDIVNG